MLTEPVFWVCLATLIVSLLSLMRRSPVVRDDSRLERKLDLILNHLQIGMNEGVNDRIRELMKSGDKLGAIKLYRERTGAGLKEAKDYVEQLSE